MRKSSDNEDEHQNLATAKCVPGARKTQDQKLDHIRILRAEW